MDDQRLIQLCISNDRKAQRLLYERFAAPMGRLCLRYLKHEADAQEVLTDGFVKVFRELERFEYRGAGSLPVWVRRIMINQSLMHLRKGHRLLFMDMEVAESHGRVKSESDLTIDAAISAEEIFEIVQQLPAGYRVVFNLVVVEGYSHKEASEMLGIGESTSRSQLTHARLKLKQLLTQRGWK